MTRYFPSIANSARRIVALLVPTSLILLGIIYLVPKWQEDQVPLLDSSRLQQLPMTDQIQIELQEKYNRAELEEHQRRTLLLAILGCWGGVFAYLIWQTHARKLLHQGTDEFCKAIELLADKDKIEVRLGGIYLLEKIARESVSKQRIVLEVLTAFIRENSPKVGDTRQWGSTEVNSLRVPTDIQAGLTVIARCHPQHEVCQLDFQDAYLVQANLIQANLPGANFQRTYLIGTNLREANLFKVNLRSADLLSANLSSANLNYANLSSANLLGANLNGTNFQTADLTGANLRGAYLGNANLRAANLNSSDLIGVYLSDANLSHANLIGANLRSAKLIGTELRNTNLSEANLTGADLSDASLHGANFTDANLRDVTFQGTQFVETDLTGADLRDAIFLETDQLSGCTLCRTQLPNNIDLDPNRDCQRSEDRLVVEEGEGLKVIFGAGRWQDRFKSNQS